MRITRPDPASIEREYRGSGLRPTRRTVISLVDSSDDEDIYRRLRPPPSPPAPGSRYGHVRMRFWCRADTLSSSSSGLLTDTQAARSGPLIDLTMDVDTEGASGSARNSTTVREPALPATSFRDHYAEPPQPPRPPRSDDIEPISIRTSLYRPLSSILSHDFPPLPLPPPPPSLPSPISRTSALPSQQPSTNERRGSPSDRRYSFPPVIPPLDGSFQRFVQGSSSDNASRAIPPPRDIPSASGTSTYNARAASVEAGYRDPRPRTAEMRAEATPSFRSTDTERARVAARARSGAWNPNVYPPNYPPYEINPELRLVDYVFPPSWYPPGYMPGYRPHSVYPYPYYTPPFLGYGADPWGYHVPSVLPPPPPLTYGLVPEAPPPEIAYDMYGEPMLEADRMPGLFSASPSPTPEPSSAGPYARSEAPSSADRTSNSLAETTSSARSASVVASAGPSTRDSAPASSTQAPAPQPSSSTPSASASASASSPVSAPDTYASWRENAEDVYQRLTAMQPVLRRLADSSHSSRRTREFAQAMRSIQSNFARHLNTTLRSGRVSEPGLAAPATSTANATRTATATATATAATQRSGSARAAGARARRHRELSLLDMAHAEIREWACTRQATAEVCEEEV